MTNMSYCRFRNTLEDLLDCERVLPDVFNGDVELSAREDKAKNLLIAACKRITERYGHD